MTLSSVVPAVMMVRLSVWLTAVLTMVDRLSRRMRAHVLAHAVEDDDGVVHRVAGDRQQAGDDVQRQVVAEERQKRQTDQQVVQRRDDGADREAQLEPQRDVGQDAGQRQHRRQDALPPQLLADHRADDLGARCTREAAEHCPPSAPR